MNILKTNGLKSPRYKRLVKLYKFTNLKHINPHSFRQKYFIFRIPKFTQSSKINFNKFTILGISIFFGTFFFFHREEIRLIINNFRKMKNSDYFNKFVFNILTSEEVKEGGVELLDSILKSKHAEEACRIILSGLFNNPTIMDETTKYGVGIFNQLLNEEELKNECLILFVDLLKDEKIKNEAVKILEYVIKRSESNDIISQYFKNVFLKDELIKSLSGVISKSAYYSMSTNETKKKFAEFLVDVWSDPAFRWNVIKKSINIFPDTKKDPKKN